MRLPDTGWLKHLSTLADDDVRAHLSGLPVDVQADMVLGLAWKDRLRLIRNSDAARELVTAMPDEEVLLTIKGVGEADAVPLLALTTPEQLRFILDVELWRGDEVDSRKAREWLGYLLSCGEQKMIEFAESADTELLAIVLSKLVKLVPNEEGAQLPEGLPGIMPDEYFTILSRHESESENTGLILRILRQWDRDRYYELLFEIHGGAGTETNEAARRWRQSRLEEKGLLDFDEAVEIYAYVGEDEARAAALSLPAGQPPSKATSPSPPAYPVLLGDIRNFFYRVLNAVENEAVKNRLRGEVSFCANRILVADARKIGEIESMRGALRRLFSLANVGLLFLAGGDTKEAGRIIERMPIRQMFQTGFSRAIDVKTAAREVVKRWWPNWQQAGFPLLRFPEDEVLRGALMRIPQYYDAAAGGAGGLRDFETMDEIESTCRVVEKVALMAEVCFDKIGLPPPHKAEPVLTGVVAHDIEDIDLRRLVVTGFVHFTLEGRFDITPLSRGDVRPLFEKVLEKRAAGDRLLKEEALTRFFEWLRQVSMFEGDRWEILKSVVRDAMKDLEDEVGGIPSSTDLEPRYVRSLIFGTRGGKAQGAG